MNSYNRNVAFASSFVYGAVLCFGMLVFLGMRDTPFLRHPSASVAVFSAFLFCFAPSILFMGATVPWLCAAYDSRKATLVLAIAPGGIFVLLTAVWLVVYDIHKRAPYFAELQRNAPWGGNRENLGAGSGDSAGNCYRYIATDLDMVDGAELASFANGVLPRPHEVWATHFSSPGIEDVNITGTRASHWRDYDAGHEPGIARGAGGRAAGHTYSAGWYRRPPVLPDHATGQVAPSYAEQGRGTGTH
ncbi:hypothetical protein LSCM4_02005 [Leishmania orientalis]|uniref:Uncharacterized protein n=1 Tax=Leishmania orientalis TaxID=2249476 RepID=A0A836GZT5_9TRYP|nr:hypothetical protein LSCM4_02005 [Leishmania orientalis]